MILHLKIFFILLIYLCSYGCTKEEIPITFLTSESELPELVVHGAVLSVYGKQFVRLSKPRSIVKGDSRVPVSNAKVSLFDGAVFYDYEESEIKGEYLTIDSLLLEAGKDYTLYIEVNGKQYSATDKMEFCDATGTLPINNIESDEDGRIYMDSYIHNFGFAANNMWILNHYYDSEGVPHKYLSPLQIVDYSTVLFTHNSALAQGLFANKTVKTGGNGNPEEFEEFVKLSLSEGYYEYIISMLNVTDWSSGLFSSIPGNTKTNLSEGATGYFFASDVKKIRMKFKDLKVMD